jgi:hypothetical protein
MSRALSTPLVNTLVHAPWNTSCNSPHFGIEENLFANFMPIMQLTYTLLNIQAQSWLNHEIYLVQFPKSYPKPLNFKSKVE